MEALLIGCKGLSECAEGLLTDYRRLSVSQAWLLIDYRRQTDCQAWLLIGYKWLSECQALLFIGYKRPKARKAWLPTDSERVARCSATLSYRICLVLGVLRNAPKSSFPKFCLP